MTSDPSATLKYRTRTAKEWIELDEVLLEDEVGLESDTGFRKKGDGKTTWNWLSYQADARSSGTINLGLGDRRPDALEIKNDAGRGVDLPLATDDAAGLISPQEKKLLTDLPEVAKSGKYGDLGELPELGEAAFRNVGAGPGDVPSGDDPRIENALSRKEATKLYLALEDAQKSYQAFSQHLAAIANLVTTEYGRDFLTITGKKDAASHLGLGSLAYEDGKFSGESSGKNTGDQKIELTGDAEGEGTGKIKVKLNPKSVLTILDEKIKEFNELLDGYLGADDAAAIYQAASEPLDDLAKLKGDGVVMHGKNGYFLAAPQEPSKTTEPELEGVGILGSDSVAPGKARLLKVGSGLVLKNGILCIDDELFAALAKASA